MEKERAMLLNAIAGKKSELKSALNIVLKPKSAEAAESARKKGNALFLQNKKHDSITHEQIFSNYCESIALAPNESQELALGYGNRSYLLLHIHRYEDCIKDIDRALKVTNSNVLKAKLLCRKTECLKKLGSSNISSILETVQNLIVKIDGEDRMKLLKMIDAVKALVVDKKNKENERIDDQKIHLTLTDDYSSRVSIEYSEKYGRHLVATRDYKPGDIIIHEKMYVWGIMDRLHTYCQYCLKPVWSSVPCSYCSWAMFCSEDCREKAWHTFHEIECSLISHFKLVNPIYWRFYMLHVRLLITAIKEAGSIENLKEKIESVDNCTDVRTKGFFENGKLVTNSIQNIYSLSKDTVNSVVVNNSVPLILISLIKYSKLKEDFDVKQIEDLEMSKDIIFLGSFLIRMMSVCSLNAFSYITKIANTDDPQECKKMNYISRRFVSTLSSLFNHSCFPTACWRSTDQNTLLIIALQPIKANSQIFISYGNLFYEENQSSRHLLLQKYKFTCDCQACIKAWPPILLHLDHFPDKDLGNNDMKKNEEMMFGNYDNFKEGKIDKKHFRKLLASITEASNFKQPSLTYCSLIDLLAKLLAAMYSLDAPFFDLCN